MVALGGPCVVGGIINGNVAHSAGHSRIVGETHSFRVCGHELAAERQQTRIECCRAQHLGYLHAVGQQFIVERCPSVEGSELEREETDRGDRSEEGVVGERTDADTSLEVIVVTYADVVGQRVGHRKSASLHKDVWAGLDERIVAAA